MKANAPAGALLGDIVVTVGVGLGVGVGVGVGAGVGPGVAPEPEAQPAMPVLRATATSAVMTLIAKFFLLFLRHMAILPAKLLIPT